MNHEGAFYMDDSYLDAHNTKGNLINDAILQKAGFVRTNEQFDSYMQDTCPGYRAYEKSANSGKYFIDITFGISNIDNEKNWNVHIDNCDRMSIGSADISTIGQFNDFMKVFKIDCKLPDYF
jgi:hypothetical protein